MADFLDQIELASNPGTYYLELAGALAVPDICGALAADDGRANGQRYRDWFDAEVAHEFFGMFDGAECYRFRCSFLHRGSGLHTQSRYSRVLFVEPGASASTFHCNVLNDALNLDVGLFCSSIVDNARRWLHDMVGTEPFDTNRAGMIRRHAEGLPPYIVGVPVIS